MKKALCIAILALLLPACGKMQPVETANETAESQTKPHVIEEETKTPSPLSIAEYNNIHDAAKDGNTDAVCYLLSKGADINARDDNGRTALSYAVESGNLDLARTLIERGVEVPSELLFKAIMGSHVEMLKLLVSTGVDVNIKALVFSETPLLRAVKNHDVESARILLDAGADVNAVGYMGGTILDRVFVYPRDKEMKKLLIEHGAVSGKELKGDKEE
jgi:ankyrin repeat protein